MGNTLPPSRDALETRLGLDAGSLEGADAERADAALSDATILALAEVNETKANDWNEAAPDAVWLVVLKAARREFENPSGIGQESLGERSVSGLDTSGVFLTVREIAVIRRAASGRLGGSVGSIKVGSPLGWESEAIL